VSPAYVDVNGVGWPAIALRDVMKGGQVIDHARAGTVTNRRDSAGFANVGAYHFDARGSVDGSSPSGREVIEHQHTRAPRGKSASHRRSDETSSAGN